MSWKQRKAAKAAARRHGQILRVAGDIVTRGAMERNVQGIDPNRIVAITFGRYRLRVTEDEALDYLNAELAERGYPLHYVDAPAPDDVTIPGQRDGQDGDQ
ncbi:hypothetical protein AB0F46_29475 [Streptomyces sp. NPDC026665]|uniref:hypothetical protein n=1 Tax=Streptomyces sp. NPDC026665 TaxID=3154798 RepID=UPI0033FBB6E7